MIYDDNNDISVPFSKADDWKLNLLILIFAVAVPPLILLSYWIAVSWLLP